MIVDSLNNFALYESVHPHFSDVKKFFHSTELESLPEGRVEINTSGSYAIIAEYSTQAINACFIEAHRKYIDIHIVLHGSEVIGVCRTEACQSEPYDEEKDFQKLHGLIDTITLKDHQFAIFFPQDGHMPKIMRGEQSERIKKLVVKIPI